MLSTIFAWSLAALLVILYLIAWPITDWIVDWLLKPLQSKNH